MGATETLSATVAPDDATDKSVQFTSSDVTVATVTPIQGKVTAVAAGTATITATTANGKTAVCEVAVTAE
ncbi:Ig-like domain-containing protein [Enterococcus dongliensis]|nr:Ig-like domain-containing protein [Enterococcus dongliensis]MDT2640643.1 Ig-like domain-containing protein [Enterococcus dongliensis]MDT2675044.1 Ig-like domain-containing protein [Enterococcus dongliensis]